MWCIGRYMLLSIDGAKATPDEYCLRNEVPLWGASTEGSSYPCGGPPQKALRGGIPRSFLEPLGHSWSHFVGICRQN